MTDAILARGRAIVARLAAVLSKPVVRVSIVPGLRGLAERRYVHDIDQPERVLGDRFALSEDIYGADILLLLSIGENLEGLRAHLERRGFSGVVCLWLTDNHMAARENALSVRECDFFFCFHFGFEDYLINPESIACPVLPAYFRHISPSVMEALFARWIDIPRISKVIAPYVLYDRVDRTRLLHHIQQHCPEYCCLFTPSDEREGMAYLGATEGERAARWLAFKASIVLPIHRDLPLRVFEGLAAGHVLLVQDGNPAFDHVLSATEQAALGIRRFPADTDTDHLRRIAREALEAFDAEGMEAVRRRHQTIMTRHTFGCRIRDFLTFLGDLAAGRTHTRLISTPMRNGLRTAYEDGRCLVSVNG